MALRDDFNGLIRQKNFKPANFIGYHNPTSSKIMAFWSWACKRCLRWFLDVKYPRFQRLTNWENAELTEQQQIYAATDAWASLLIYLQLMKEKKLTKKQVDKLLADAAAEQAALLEMRNAAGSVTPAAE